MARRERLYGKKLKEQRRQNRQLVGRLRFGFIGVLITLMSILAGTVAAASFATAWAFPYRTLSEFHYVRATTLASDRAYGRYGGCVQLRIQLDQPPYTLAYGCSAPGAREVE